MELKCWSVVAAFAEAGPWMPLIEKGGAKRDWQRLKN
jgi:hypothetical protein